MVTQPIYFLKAMGVGAVSFAQIVKASEPVFAAVVGLAIPPADVKPIL